MISLICRAYVTLIEENCGPRAVVPRMPDLNFELRREKVDVRLLVAYCALCFVLLCLVCHACETSTLDREKVGPVA